MAKLSKFQAGGKRQAAGQGYTYFLPSAIYGAFEVDVPRVLVQLERAMHAVGELNGMARLVPNVDLFLQSFVKSEAVSSSRIEGTQTDLEEAFKSEENVREERRDDWLEVNLYVRALNTTIAELPKLPLCNRLLQQAHGILLSSGRGADKLPGEYRRSQNWIGGSSVQTAEFVPPHDQHVGKLMGDLEKFLNDDEHAVPDLARAGIAHYQFETIHPFLDGNGRIGRMLIPLFLVQRGLLDRPLLYLSVFLEKHKNAYYRKLTLARAENDLAGWLLFFLEGVERVARFSIETLRDILNLKDALEARVRTRGAVGLLRALDFAYQKPVFNMAELSAGMNVSLPTAGKAIAELERRDVLQKISLGRRNQWYLFAPYMAIIGREFE